MQSLGLNLLFLSVVMVILIGCSPPPMPEYVYAPYVPPTTSRLISLPAPAKANIREIKRDIKVLKHKLDKRDGLLPVDWSQVPEAIP